MYGGVCTLFKNAVGLAGAESGEDFVDIADVFGGNLVALGLVGGLDGGNERTQRLLREDVMAVRLLEQMCDCGC